MVAYHVLVCLERDVKVMTKETNAPWQDEGVLRQKYWDERKTCDEIGDELGCSGRTVSTWLQKHDIETRGPEDYNDGPWRDKERLERLFVDQGRTSYEIADKLGCSQNCIMRWLHRFGIEREQPWKDKDTLKRLYVDEQMTTYEIGDKFGVSNTAIGRALKDHGIRRRKQLPTFYTDNRGYERIHHQHDHVVTPMAVHRLTALAHDKLSFSEFASGEMDVHHKNGIPWDNRPGNLEAMPHDEHSRRHGIERGGLNG